MTRTCTALLSAAIVMHCSVRSLANEKTYQRCVRGAAMVITSGGRGSGALIDKERRLVITANHVTGSQTSVEVAFPIFNQNGEVLTDARAYAERRTQVRGRVLHADRDRDISVIQVDSLPDNVEAIPLARASAKPGQDIHCIGCAAFRHGGLFGYSYGKVRNVFRRQIAGQMNGKVIVETQIPTNKGDSGGPIFNDSGELVAIVSQGTTGVTPPQNDPFYAMQVVDHSVDVTEIRAALDNIGKGPAIVASTQNPAANPVNPTQALMQFAGELRAGDTMMGNRYSKTHAVKLEAGVTYIINLASAQFDTYLHLYDAGGNRIAANDDGGNGTDSRLEFSPSKTGDFRLVATSYTPLATGRYTLVVEKR